MIVLPSWGSWCPYNLKSVGACHRQAPSPSPFASVSDSHRLDAALNSTEQMHFPKSQKKMASVMDTSISFHEPNLQYETQMKRLDRCLWLCRMARTTGFFSRIISSEFGALGIFLLAHSLERNVPKEEKPLLFSLLRQRKLHCFQI